MRLLEVDHKASSRQLAHGFGRISQDLLRILSVDCYIIQVHCAGQWFPFGQDGFDNVLKMGGSLGQAKGHS